MKKHNGNKGIGIVLVIFGVLLALKSLNIVTFNYMFRGWWTLFIVVPCLVGLFEGKSRGKNVIGLLFGLILLLWRRGYLSGGEIVSIAFSITFLALGFSLIFHGSGKKREKDKTYSKTYTYDTNKTWESDNNSYETCPPKIMAVLNGKAVQCLDGKFYGTQANIVLGNLQLDLRRAKIEHDVYVNLSLVLGGADIYLPEGVPVICDLQSVLCDVRDIKKNERNQDYSKPAIHIVGSCVLGGIEMK